MIETDQSSAQQPLPEYWLVGQPNRSTTAQNTGEDSSSDELSPTALAKKLSNQAFVWGGLHLPVTESTNTLARQLARAGVPSGFLVTTHSQTAGRGRGDHRWECPARLGLLCSLIYRPQQLSARYSFRLTEWVAVSLAHALHQLTDLTISLKYPNDLMIAQRKLGGVLIETVLHRDMVASAVLGWGINVGQQPQDFSETLRPTATSLRIETGTSFSPITALDFIVNALAQFEQELIANPDQLHARWQQQTRAER